MALSEDSHAPDPMASYRAGSNNLIRITFQEGRAFWRDLSALLPDPTGKMAHPAAVLQGAINLNQSMTFDTVEQPLLVAGLASDQAKLLRWRMEQITLPAALMADPAQAMELRQLVGQAETVFSYLRSFASHMLADILPDPDSKDTRARARNLFDRGAATALFFSHAERSLGPVMKLLADEHGDEAQTRWCQALLEAADQSWKAVHLSMGQSPAVLRAEARQWPKYRGWLRGWQSETNPACTAQKVSA
jgi:CRISPR system Cascade subunit CasA